jgi:hypothetical protein
VAFASTPVDIGKKLWVAIFRGIFFALAPNCAYKPVFNPVLTCILRETRGGKLSQGIGWGKGGRDKMKMCEMRE